MSREPTYPSDLTDDRWALIEPLLPPAHTGGRPEEHPRRDVVDAILYVVRTGCSWRHLPTDLPPWQTVYWHFTRWKEAGVTDRITGAPRPQVRAAAGRDQEPSAGIIDSQSVKGADTVPQAGRGYDAAKRINGRKRFIVTATLGLLLVVCVMAASVPGRDGAKTTLLSLYLATPVRFVFADTGFAGAGGLDVQAAVHGAVHRAQGPRPGRVRGDRAPVGGGADRPG
ncbi:IS5 family transposase [Nocardiopsis sp. N85]|uniref:IS5 family transposase n=1 Tax=Nocardiopsis sp. N85 TaxID=3029400 RepID=UPI00237FA59B|nr:IS5 family transposase [Nocardiopsis sp. N85]MDE3722889.1 IS5 family transposase [Nocardiopsis sp. N85]